MGWLVLAHKVLLLGLHHMPPDAEMRPLPHVLAQLLHPLEWPQQRSDQTWQQSLQADD